MIISIRLSPSQGKSLKELSRRTGASRSELVRAAIESFCRSSARTGARAYEMIERWIGCAKSGRKNLSSGAHDHVRTSLHGRARRKHIKSFRLLPDPD